MRARWRSGGIEPPLLAALRDRTPPLICSLGGGRRRISEVSNACSLFEIRVLPGQEADNGRFEARPQHGSRARPWAGSPRRAVPPESETIPMRTHSIFVVAAFAAVLSACGGSSDSTKTRRSNSPVTSDTASCSDITCPSGQHCVLEGVECFTTPCPPEPICVSDPTPPTPPAPSEPSCDQTTCPDGEHCELQPVECIRAPCPPQPTCVPNPMPPGDCSQVTCPAGQHCVIQGDNCFQPPCPVAVCE
jgi:hypothetical protein